MTKVTLPVGAFESQDLHEILVGVPGPVIRSKKFPWKCLECNSRRSVYLGVMFSRGADILCTRCVLCGYERPWKKEAKNA